MTKKDVAAADEARTREPQTAHPENRETDRVAELEKQLAEARQARDAALRELATVGKTAEPEAAGGKKRGDYVYVYANLPSGQIFALPDGRRVEIAGVPVNRLQTPEGKPLGGGLYGKTRIGTADWEAVERIYGGMGMFRHGLVFAAANELDGQREAASRSELRHGLEPIDVKNDKRLGSMPASKKDAEL